MKLVISNGNPEPIYEQIGSQIRAEILNGNLEPGSPLPSIRTLARELSVSILTVKHAYDTLEGEGYVDTVMGKGCFVAGENRELLREQRRASVEEKLAAAIDEARRFGIGREELTEIFSLLMEEERG